MRSTIPIMICCLYALSAVNATPSSKGQNAEVQQGNTEAAEAPKLWSDDKDNNDDKWSKDDKDGKYGHHDHEGDNDKHCASRSVSILIGTSTYAIPCLPNGSIVDLNVLISPPGSNSATTTTDSTTTTTDTTSPTTDSTTTTSDTASTTVIPPNN